MANELLTLTVNQDFRLFASNAEGEWRVRFEGTLDMPNASALLQPALQQLHAAVLKSPAETVHLDVAPVEYINSSGLKAFMAYFLQVHHLKEHRYSLRVTYDRNKNWQTFSLVPMGMVTDPTVQVIAR